MGRMGRKGEREGGRCAYRATGKSEERFSAAQKLGVHERTEAHSTGPRGKAEAQSTGGTPSSALGQHQECSWLNDWGGGEAGAQG